MAMTVEEIKAVADATKEAADLVAAYQERLKAAEAAKLQPTAVKAAADKLIAAGAIDVGLRDRAEAMLGSHQDTVDFLLSLAEDRAKVASAYSEIRELNPGAPADATGGDLSADAEFAADMARLRASLPTR